MTMASAAVAPAALARPDAIVLMDAPTAVAPTALISPRLLSGRRVGSAGV
ncbi:hypothetical protein GCM10009574_091640 [Streptomyces asiaticus]|uniref:Uncharacterized protein n=2 Tax=Streptomyces rhizosphaericus TaxID=114699 RepID=A0ABN1SKX9_9ACTN